MIKNYKINKEDFYVTKRKNKNFCYLRDDSSTVYYGVRFWNDAISIEYNKLSKGFARII